MEFQSSGGALALSREGWHILPEHAGDKPRVKPEKHDTDDLYLPHFLHVKNFIQCAKTREKPAIDIESVHRSTTTCHLANISLKVGRNIFWDAKTERCRRWDSRNKKTAGEDTEANAYLLREPRKPWSIPLS